MGKIWFFEIKDGASGGFIIADTEDAAWKKLALDRGVTVEKLKEFTKIFPMTALDLNNPVHKLW